MERYSFIYTLVRKTVSSSSRLKKNLFEAYKDGVSEASSIVNLNENQISLSLDPEKLVQKTEYTKLLEEKIQLEIKLAESLASAGDYRVQILEKEVAKYQCAIVGMIEQMEDKIEKYELQIAKSKEAQNKAEIIIVDTAQELKKLRFMKKYCLPTVGILGFAVGSQLGYISKATINQFGYKAVPIEQQLPAHNSTNHSQ
jgi:hypothetical protein